MSAADTLGLVGSTVDRLRFDACIDAGGFGIVYRGWHLALEAPVAIKCLRLTKLAKTSESLRGSVLARLRNSSNLLVRLSQGNQDIVRLLEAGELFAHRSREPLAYFASEWIDGRQLSDDLNERRERGLKGRTLQETLDLVESAALAIAHAHAHGVVHRDIKPANLILARTPGGLRLKVLDFGLAAILDHGLGTPTADGMPLYSPAHCAPEQLGADGSRSGPWTDIYALALVLLEVMRGEKVRHTGNVPLRASSIGLRLPPAVEDLLARAVSHAPLERPANAGVFWSALREVTRRSAPPITSAEALAATAADGAVAEAMLRVRAAAASASPAAQASPWTGTMLMINAPGRPLQVLAPETEAKGDAEPPLGTTLPLAAPMTNPAATVPAQPSPLPAPPTSPHAVTAGLALAPSPLASSLGPAMIVSPLAPPRAVSPQASSSALHPGAPLPVELPKAAAPPLAPAPENRVPSNPPGTSEAAPPRTNALVIGLLALLVLALAAASAVLLLHPPR